MGLNNMDDVKKMMVEVKKVKKSFISTPKKHCEVILFNFQKPVDKKRFRDTDYVHYECKFIKINDLFVSAGKHIIQLSYKIAWYQLYNFLEDSGFLKEKDLHLMINKKDNYCFVYNLHPDDKRFKTCTNTKH